jgi:hypothetical protein
MQVRGTHLVAGVERTRALTDRLRARQIAVPNRGADGTRTAVHQQPKPLVPVRLELDEVIAAAEGRELEHAFMASGDLEAGLTE